MKKSALITIIIFIGRVCFAQNTNEDLSSHWKNQLSHNQTSIANFGCLKKQNTFLVSPRSVVWNWDTIVSYDTSGVKIARMTQTFDINGNSLIYYYDQWHTNHWDFCQRETNSYNANGNIIYKLCEYYNTNIWQNTSRNFYKYDSPGVSLDSILVESWSLAAWENSWRYIYTNDSNGLIRNVVLENWDANNWTNQMRWTETFDSSGVLLTQKYYDWMQSSWKPRHLITYTYDTSGYLVLKLDQYYNSSGSLPNTYRYIFTNDNSGNHKVVYYDVWSILDQIYFHYNRMTYDYDSNHNSIAGKQEYWDGINAHPSAVIDLPGYMNGKEVDLANPHRFEAGFTNDYTNIGIPETENNSLLIFPNPAFQTLHIEGIANSFKAEVYDLSGKFLLTKQINTNQIDINSLAKGLYFIKLSTEEGSVVRKFVKE